MSGDHVIDVGPVARIGGAAGSPPAYAYRCSCGAHGVARVAVNLTGKARGEALEDARRDALTHQREAQGRPAARPDNVVDIGNRPTARQVAGRPPDPPGAA